LQLQSATIRQVPSKLPAVARRFREIGRDFYARGWVLGTSGNFSVVVRRRPLELVITASSVSKGDIGPQDVLQVGADGMPVRRKRARASAAASTARPSAETLLHVAVAQTRGAGAVLHTHSVWATILSEVNAARGGLPLRGLEMLKGLEGVHTHDHAEWVPILDNDQNIAALAGRVEALLEPSPGLHAFMLRGHGLYTWGEDLAQARRHVEILEFLLEATGRMEAIGHGSDQDS
jgi:methylthioribulose-1-phosphate dehydratase